MNRGVKNVNIKLEQWISYQIISPMSRGVWMKILAVNLSERGKITAIKVYFSC